MKTIWPDYDRSILSTLSALTGYFGVPLRSIRRLQSSRPFWPRSRGT